MKLNNNTLIEGLHEINNSLSFNNIVLIKCASKNKTKLVTYLGKIYCQGFTLISSNQNEKYTKFLVKKTDFPKIYQEKKYKLFSKQYPYAEYLGEKDLYEEIKKNTNLTYKDTLTFWGKVNLWLK